MNNICLSARKPNCIVEVMEIDNIYPHVEIHSTKFYTQVKASIVEEGMQKPIVIVPTSIEDWAHMYDINPKLIPPPDFPYGTVVNRVACGHNRLQAAKELGYKFIDVYVARTIREGSAVCQSQRKCS